MLYVKYVKKQDKDILHAIKDYDQAKTVWQLMVEPTLKSHFFVYDLNDWIISNFSKGYNRNMSQDWLIVWVSSMEIA